MLLTEHKTAAETWFRTLRDRICCEFEAIEHAYAAESPTSHFTLTSWTRPEGGGGVMGQMKGRVFEKVGVNISTVHGEFSEQFAKEIPGAANDPRFWATGISLVAHMANPHVPAVHMNTRMITVGDGTRLWFGGGADLNPALPIAEDTAQFHAAFERACNVLETATCADASSFFSSSQGVHSTSSGSSYPGPTQAAGDSGPALSVRPGMTGYYSAFAAWCEEYFYLPHRQCARGVGGIFYDYLGLNRFGADTSLIEPGQFGKGGVGKEKTAAGMALAANAPIDWGQGLAFTQTVGTTFLETYAALVRRRMQQPFTVEERHAQLVYRGRYAEYNLLYDRGTRFGLMTGGNPDAILMSLPPLAVWE